MTSSRRCCGLVTGVAPPKNYRREKCWRKTPECRCRTRKGSGWSWRQTGKAEGVRVGRRSGRLSASGARCGRVEKIGGEIPIVWSSARTGGGWSRTSACWAAGFLTSPECWTWWWWWTAATMNCSCWK